MLEVFYETESKIVTAWRSGDRIGIRKLRDDESKVLLDIETPTNGATVRDYLYDEATQRLILNPDYVEPQPSRAPFAEIDKLDARVKALEGEIIPKQ